MSWRLVSEWAGFQAVWLACALGAAQGRNAPGVIAAALFVAAVHATRRWSRADCVPLLASGIAGAFCESILVALGLISFSAPWPSPQLAPAWIVALWVAFGATLPALAAALGRHPTIKGAVLGLCCGPLAYWAGSRLGALDIRAPAATAYLATAVIWSIALPSLIAVRQRVRGEGTG